MLRKSGVSGIRTTTDATVTTGVISVSFVRLLVTKYHQRVDSYTSRSSANKDPFCELSLESLSHFHKYMRHLFDDRTVLDAVRHTHS